MNPTLPAPYIAEYEVRRLRFETDLYGRVSPVCATYAPEVINTKEIESILHQPNTFLIGWRECHHYPKQERSGKEIITRAAETFIYKEHPVNAALCEMLGQLYREAYSTGGNTVIPRIRSMEQILFDAKWKFKLEIFGQKQIIYPMRLSQKGVQLLKDSPEMQLLTKYVANKPKVEDELVSGPIDDIADNWEEPVSDLVDDYQPAIVPEAPEESRLDRLELMMSQILQQLSRAPDASTHPFGHGERRPFEPEPPQTELIGGLDGGPSGSFSNQQGPSVY